MVTARRAAAVVLVVVVANLMYVVNCWSGKEGPSSRVRPRELLCEFKVW